MGLFPGFSFNKDDYLRKPFSQEELIVRIHNLVALTGRNTLPASTEQESVKLGRYTFVADRQELLLDGQPLRQLSHRE